MGTPIKLLNLANAAAQMDIMYRLECALAGEGNMVVLSLKQAIERKQPTALIIATVKDMIRDNRAAMENIIGETLTCKIECYV